jgi:hypothetical protein
MNVAEGSSVCASPPARYAWIEARLLPKVHRLDRTGRTYCQAENITSRLTFSQVKPTKANVDCKLCLELMHRNAVA